MKKFLKYYILILCCIIGVILFSGCSGSIPNDEKIKTDLNSTEFINAAKLYDNDSTKMLPVTEVAIIETQKENKNCRFTCNVIQENEHYKKETQLVISYIKSDDWYMDTYNEIDTSITPVSGVPDEILTAYAKGQLGYRNSTECLSVECLDITHSFNQDELVDNVTINCIAKNLNCDITAVLKARCTFGDNKCDDRWVFMHSDRAKITERKWKYDELEGSTWYGTFTSGRKVRINSIDKENQTMNIDYGYLDLTYTEVCRYEIKDFINETTAGQPAQALVMSLSNDMYKLEILENGVFCGGSLTKIAE